MSSEPSVPFAECRETSGATCSSGSRSPPGSALVADMSRSQLERFTDRLDPDEVTDVLGYANAETREAVLGTLDAERREKIDFLLSFDPESAAGLMNLDYVTVDRSRGSTRWPSASAASRSERGASRPSSSPTARSSSASFPARRSRWRTRRPNGSRTTSGRRRRSGTTAPTRRCSRCSVRTASGPSRCSTRTATSSV